MSSKLSLQGFTRKPELKAETSEFLVLLSGCVAQLNMDVQVWRAIKEAARTELEDTVREAATGNNPNLLLGSLQFHQRVIELTIRLEILEELLNRLPLRDLEAEARKERQDRSRI